jgi:hypothetical protein
MNQALAYLCPFCDREVRVGTPCGGCSKRQKPAPTKVKRSWEQNKLYDHLDLPDEDFDYDEFAAREFGRLPHKKIGVKLHWWLVGVALLVLMVLAALL